MSENWKIQVSPKLTDGTLINLRAETPAEAEQILDWAIANAAKIGDAVKAVNAVSVVGAAFPGATVSVEQQQAGAVQASAVQQVVPQQGGWNTAAATPPPAFAQPAAPAAAQPPAQHCVHGAMTYREGTSKAGKPYRAFFCPTPKGTVGQCQPEFLR